MINSFHTLLSTAFLAAVGYIATEPFSLSAPPFIEVHDFSYSNGMINVERTVSLVDFPSKIADWRVTIVGNRVDTPTCNTIAGPLLNEGWSRYSPSKRGTAIMTLDEWVGDEGCQARLIAGQYEMFVTWTPRGEIDPVFYYAVIDIP